MSKFTVSGMKNSPQNILIINQALLFNGRKDLTSENPKNVGNPVISM